MRAFVPVYRRVAASSPTAPTLYARFTFTVRNVKKELLAGSPRVGRTIQRTRMRPWFFRSILSTTLPGAEFSIEDSFDRIDMIVADVYNPRKDTLPLSADVDTRFFLEFVTLIAYQIEDPLPPLGYVEP